MSTPQPDARPSSGQWPRSRLGAECITPESVAFVVRHTSGFVRVPVAAAETRERLNLPQMVRHNEQRHSPAYTVTVDASRGVSTGISTRDRCRTIRVLADETSGPGDLTRPGHVLPLRAAADGLLARAGFTEAVVEPARLGLLGGQNTCTLLEFHPALSRAVRV
ncbi:3,4-dihydroxy-2-butanone-4-phosphate synthase [Streptomyces sp. NPDC001982]|uniref:3,4-dihydroxy-2-butanone-4-phosphate synthase n=1 Tax=Streptomyces sp. NPDC001982 TaxID=3154405 RepID=UPI00331CFAA1